MRQLFDAQIVQFTPKNQVMVACNRGGSVGTSILRIPENPSKSRFTSRSIHLACLFWLKKKLIGLSLCFSGLVFFLGLQNNFESLSVCDFWFQCSVSVAKIFKQVSVFSFAVAQFLVLVCDFRLRFLFVTFGL